MHVFFAVQFLLAALHWKDRIFTDTSFYLFHTINAEWFRIEHQRFVSVIGELSALVAVKLDAPLHVVLKVYSLGHVAFFYAVFLLCLYGMRSVNAAVCVILFCLVGARREFFTPQYEIWYGMILVPVFYEMLRRNVLSNLWLFVTFALLTETILFSHPLMFLPIGFLIVWHYSDKPLKQHAKKLAVLALLFVPMFVVKFLFADEYEAGKTLAVQDASVSQTLFNPDYLKGFVLFFVRNYPDMILIWLASLWMLFRNGLRTKAWLLVGYFLGFVLLINITQRGYDESLYYDRMYQPLWAALIPVFLFDIRLRFNGLLEKLSLAFIVLIVLVRTNDIIQTGKIHAQRTAQYERLIENARRFGGKKFIVDERNIRKDYTLMEWSLPIETMLLSSLYSPDSTLQIASTDDLNYNDNKARLHRGFFMFRRFEIEPIEWLNQKYFKLPHEDYKLLNTSFDIADENIFAKQVSISIDNVDALQKSKVSNVQVTVDNRNEMPVPSGREDLFITYRWNQNGKTILNDALRTPFETDVVGKFSQDIVVKAPDVVGNYELTVDIVSKDTAWWNIDAVKTVIVK